MAETTVQFYNGGESYTLSPLQTERLRVRKDGPPLTGLEQLVILYPVRKKLIIKTVIARAQKEQSDLKNQYTNAVFDCKATTRDDKNALQACLTAQGVTQLMLSYMLYKN